MSQPPHLDGDALIAALAALAHPHRMRIIGALHGGTNYVSQLARELGLSRPLLHMHLQKLQAAGFVTSETTVADDGKARRYFTVTDFVLTLDAPSIARASVAVTVDSKKATEPSRKGKDHG